MMPTAPTYSLDADYSAPYNSLRQRIAENYDRARTGLAGELAARGINTAGVTTAPTTAMYPAQRMQEYGAAGDFAAAQAGTKIQDRQLAAQFEGEKASAEAAMGRESSLRRSLARKQLMGQVIGGAVGAVGAVGGEIIGGPVGAMAGASLGNAGGQALASQF
jgi:hypothetical protein